MSQGRELSRPLGRSGGSGFGKGVETFVVTTVAISVACPKEKKKEEVFERFGVRKGELPVIPLCNLLSNLIAICFFPESNSYVLMALVCCRGGRGRRAGWRRLCRALCGIYLTVAWGKEGVEI